MMNEQQQQQRRENLGPAERLINALLGHTDHIYHGRPGIVVEDNRTKVGVRWDPVTYKQNADGTKTVYRLVKQGRKNRRVEAGTMNGDNTITRNDQPVGTYQTPGLFGPVAAWLYRQVAEVWKLDNEFVARWASHAWHEKHRDLKVVLASFLLVQSRKGDPILDGGERLFDDDDYRNVGEAMLLLQEKGKDLNPKHILRCWELLMLPEVAEINRELGFGRSARRPFLGRWPLAVEKWLRYRENNPQMLEGLVKAGFAKTVRRLAQHAGYKPSTDKFFEILRWKQKQSGDGRRELAIGKAVKKSESWEGLSERQICNRITKEKLNWKVIVSKLPVSVGVTRAVAAAAIEAGSLSDKDLIILTPTLESLGLLEVQDIRERWQNAVQRAEDMRAANIARNVRSKEVKEKLEEGADQAAQRDVEEVMRGLRVYFMIDISGSMAGSIEAAKPLIAKLVQAFPLDRIHIAVFNTSGREVRIKHASTKGVEAAFRGIRAAGGTDYGAGVRVLEKHRPNNDEDTLFIFVGDEEARPFTEAVQRSGLNPMAFGFLKTVPYGGAAGWRYQQYGADNNIAVRETASQLGVPCFNIETEMFSDPYAVPRTIRNLVAATPVGVARQTPRKRVGLIDVILQTELLQKPAWA